MKRFLLSLWVDRKVRHGKRRGWIGPVTPELYFLAEKTQDEIRALKYIQDRTRSGLPWDYQGDAIECFKRGGGDCNWLNRVWQVFWTLSNCEAYLVTFLHRPAPVEHLWNFYTPRNGFERWFYKVLNFFGVALAHATCIVRSKSGRWYGSDYGSILYGESFDDVLAKIAEQYGIKVSAYVAQDVNWKRVKA